MFATGGFMKLTSPIYQLKRRARAFSRQEKIPLHSALDQIARLEGFGSWSLLANTYSNQSPAHPILDGLAPSDLLLVGARPNQGKTLLSLELAMASMQAGNHCHFFSLDYTERDILESFKSLGANPIDYQTRFEFDCSDNISADYIVAQLHNKPAETLVVIDYLQALDQKRSNPELNTQVATLRTWAQQHGHIMVFIAQIDRTYSVQQAPVPNVQDLRLPNPLDTSLFSKFCFIQDGQLEFEAA